MGLIYSLLVTLAAALAAPWYFLRYGRHGFPAGYWRERLGGLPDSINETNEKGALWVHAVSVGETLAVAGLAAEIKRRFPTRAIYLSHVTPAGRAAGVERMPWAAGRFYLPIDLKRPLRRVFALVRPAMLMIAETEVWPNLLSVAREYGTPVVLVNARLSGSSFAGYRRFGFFFRRVFASLDWVFAQTEADAQRFRELGVARVSVAGNLKFDGRPPTSGKLARFAREALDRAGRGPVLVAASTMAGEEPLVLDAWHRIRRRSPGALLILVPRHPQRFEEVARLLDDERCRFVRRSSLDKRGAETRLAEAEVLLLDTIGELAGVFELADVAFVGGSLVATGGHNLLEPAFWAKPVIFGPHMENFRDIAIEFLAEGAGFRVENAGDLAARTLALFEDAPLRSEMGLRGKRLLERGSGATGRILERLGEWLGAEPARQPLLECPSAEPAAVKGGGR